MKRSCVVKLRRRRRERLPRKRCLDEPVEVRALEEEEEEHVEDADDDAE